MQVVTKVGLEKVWWGTNKAHQDDRGYFKELYVEGQASNHYLEEPHWVQDNLSYSIQGVLRGLHYSVGPNAQAKRVTCLIGRVWDVVANIDPTSPGYGNSFGIELSGANGNFIYVPVGFAHGFVVLSETAMVQYKVSAPYDKTAERGVCWNDPVLDIHWPILAPLVTPRDLEWPLLPLKRAAS